MTLLSRLVALILLCLNSYSVLADGPAPNPSIVITIGTSPTDGGNVSTVSAINAAVANNNLDFDSIVRVLNPTAGKWADWQVADVDGNRSTKEVILIAHGTYAPSVRSAGGGGAGTYFFVAIVSSGHMWEFSCTLGGESISCNDETDPV